MRLGDVMKAVGFVITLSIVSTLGGSAFCVIFLGYGPRTDIVDLRVGLFGVAAFIFGLGLYFNDRFMK